MSIVSTKLHWTGQSGSWKGPNLREYTAIWLVEVNDPRDDPVVVLATSAIPPLYSSYAIGNGFDGLAFLKEKSASRVQDTDGRLLWSVVGTYKTKGDEEEGEDEDGKPTDDPLQFREEMSITHTRFSLPVETAIYRGGMLAGAEAKIGLTVDEVGPVLNSAGAVFDPPAEADGVHQHIIITTHEQDYPLTHDEFVNAINSEDWDLTRPQNNFSKLYPKYTVKSWVGGTFQIVNGIKHWKMTYEFDAIVHPTMTWRFNLLDRGVHRRALEGDKDGRGGTFSLKDIKVGDPLVAKLTDRAGVPVSEPVLLDGDGKPLGDGGAPVYLEYSYYEEIDFGLLGLSNS